MRIGELANKAGVNIQTIRFYEREGVMGKPARTASGYRAYNERDLARVVFIKQCQHLGFSLKEVKELSEIHDSLDTIRHDGTRPPKEFQRILTIASERLETIEHKIMSLEQMRQYLRRLLGETETVLAGECPAPRLKNIE